MRHQVIVCISLHLLEKFEVHVLHKSYDAEMPLSINSALNNLRKKNPRKCSVVSGSMQTHQVTT